MKNSGQGSLEKEETVTTTLGELIAAITDIAFEAGKTEKEGYELASVALESILRRKYQKNILDSSLN